MKTKKIYYLLLGSYYTYWSYYTYCSDFWWIVLFIFITALPFLYIIRTVLKRKCIVLLIFITVLLFLLYVLFSKTRPVTFRSPGLIKGTYKYVLY